MNGHSVAEPIPFEIFDNKNNYVSNLVRQLIICCCDVLVDGRYVHELRDHSLKFRGSSNQRVIDVKKTLETGEITSYCE